MHIIDKINTYNQIYIMKITRKSWSLLSAVIAGGFLFMPVACNEYVDQYTPGGEEDKTPEVVKVEKSFTSEIKSGFVDAAGESKSYIWDGGDEINVYWGPVATDASTAVTKQSGASAIFIGEVAEADNYAAVFPASTKAIFAETGKVNVTIPAVQDGTYASACVMAAVTGNDNLKFAFENVGAIINFTVEKDNVAQVVFTAQEALGGTVEMNFSSAVATAVSGTANSVTFPSATVNGAVTPGDYYVCVAPVVLAGGLTISAVNTDGGVLAMNTIETIEKLERSHIYEVGAVDYVDPATITEYFVTVEGKGTKSGLDWENAMSVAELRKLLIADEATVMERGKSIDGKTIHMAAGTYVMADSELKYCPVNFVGYPVPVSVVFKGGYDEANPQTPGAAPTVFSGNKEVAGFVFGDNVKFTFDGITFADASATTDSELIKTTRAAVFVNSPTATLSFNNCIFKDNIQRGITASDYEGGAAICLVKGYVNADKCLFVGNISGSRGAAIRVDDKNDKGGLCFLNDCIFTENMIERDSYGMAIFARNNIAINKCIFINNAAKDASKNNPSLNFNHNYVMINSTVIEDSFFGSGTGTIRTETETKNGVVAAMMNNVIINTHPKDDDANKAWAILASKANGVVSKGYNLYYAKNGGISHADRLPAHQTDADVDTAPTYTFDANTYQLTMSDLGFTFAANADVEAMLRGSDMVATAGVTTFAADFADWLKTIGAL